MYVDGCWCACLQRMCACFAVDVLAMLRLRRSSVHHPLLPRPFSSNSSQAAVTLRTQGPHPLKLVDSTGTAHTLSVGQQVLFAVGSAAYIIVAA